MDRLAPYACLLTVVCSSACGGAGTGKSTVETTHGVPAADAGTGASSAEPAPEPVDPWPSTKPGAAWTVVDWKMTEHEAAEALKQAGFNPLRRNDPATGRVESVEVVSPLNGWKRWR